MPRDMSGMGRYPPQLRYQPFAFYTAVRMGDPEMLAKIMQVWQQTYDHALSTSVPAICCH